MRIFVRCFCMFGGFSRYQSFHRRQNLCTSVHYKPTDSHSYLLYSSSHPSHVKNSLFHSIIPFLILSFLYFVVYVVMTLIVQTGHHRAQQIDRQSTLQTSQKEKNDRIPFMLTFHPHNHAVKSIVLKNFKLLQNDPETSRIFSQPPLISFKHDKNIGNFLVRSAFLTNDQPGTVNWNAEKISGPKRSVKISEKLYIVETGRRPGNRFRENLRDVEKDDKDASKPVARHLNLPNHTKQRMSVCGLSLHLGSTESRKNLEQRFIFQIGTLNSTVSTSAFHSTNLFLFFTSQFSHQ